MAYKEKFYIKYGSQGCFLDPPLYPTYKYHIENGKKTTFITLSKKICKNEEYSYLANDIKERCKELINEWEIDKLFLDHDIVKDWIYQTLGYFNDCFKGLNDNWDCDKLKVINYKKVFDNDKHYYKFLVNIQSLHAGVHHVKKFYPEYVATIEDFKNAYWGKPKLFKGQ